MSFPGIFSPQQAQFQSTHWSVLLNAGDSNQPGSTESLARLCEVYWPPLYVFARRQGHSPQDAQDLTQGFFERFLEKRYYAEASPEKGRFRSFLLTTFKHYISDERIKECAQKRGGGKPMISLDTCEEERRFVSEPSNEQSPEKLFDRRWALTLLDAVFEKLERLYHEAGKEALFEVIHGYLDGSREQTGYTDAANRLGMKEGAVRMAVYRMRKRYGQLFLEEVAATVSSEAQMDEEVMALRSILGE